MCLAPILIDNPYYNSPVKDPVFRYIHDTKNSKMPVPCGRCASCIHLKQIYLVQRVQMEALNNDLFYGTLTYNNDSLPIAEYGNIKFAYPDYSDWQKMLKMIRKDYPDLVFKYMLVSEYGGKKHRPHFHFILSLPRISDLLASKVGKAYELFNIFLLYWRRNYGSSRVPIWKPLCTYINRNGKYNYDLHYLDPNSSKDGLDGVSFYVTKYLLKYDDYVEKFKSLLFFNLNDSDFHEAWLKFKPRCLISKGFGLIQGTYDHKNMVIDESIAEHIRYGISFSDNDNSALFPYYVSKQNGSTYPLAPYYSRRFLTPEDMIIYVSRRPEIRELTSDDLHHFNVMQNKFDLTKSFLRSQNLSFYNDMDDTNKFFDSIPDYKHSSFSDSDFSSDWEDF